MRLPSLLSRPRLLSYKALPTPLLALPHRPTPAFTALKLKSNPVAHLSTSAQLRFRTADEFDDMSFPTPPPLGPSQAGTVDGQGPAKIHLWTAGTPNGYKVSVTLEELRALYPEEAKGKLSYDVSAISIWKNEQKVSKARPRSGRGGVVRSGCEAVGRGIHKARDIDRLAGGHGRLGEPTGYGHVLPLKQVSPQL